MAGEGNSAAVVKASRALSEPGGAGKGHGPGSPGPFGRGETILVKPQATQGLARYHWAHWARYHAIGRRCNYTSPPNSGYIVSSESVSL